MYIDLSIPISNDTPVYPGDPKVRIEQAADLEKDGFSDHVLTIGTHAGTHIDAPLHMLKKGKSLDQFAVEKFVGNGVLIDARNGFDFSTVKSLEINEGDIVLLYTGNGKNIDKPSYFEEYEQVPENISQYLVDRKIKMVGMDMCSPDHEPFDMHKILLSAEVLIIENLSNLEKLVGKNFKVYALPLKLNVDGAPARVIAEVAVL